MNIIVHKVPESVATESAACIANMLLTLLTCITYPGSLEVLNITHLDKKLDNKPRLLKVHLHQKRRILLCVKKLTEMSDTFQKVYITPDLSLNERKENKRLCDELFQHKNAGEKDLIIQRGKL